MRTSLAANAYGTPVSVHRCADCGSVFTVCPPSDDSWGGCLAESCPSYDLNRDIDLFWDVSDVRTGPT